MLGSLQPTEYDLQFELLRVPVRVSPWFWLMAALLGSNALRQGLPYLFAWIAVVFVSVLVHEYGHALTARAFGYHPRILLYQFGGLAMYEPYRYSRSKSILITLAGPFAGFALLGLTLVFSIVAVPALKIDLSQHPVMNDVIYQLIVVNLFWGILNLMPVFPLDGGRICQDVCTWISPYRGRQIAVGIGMIVAGCIAAAALAIGEIYLAIMFGILAVQNLQLVQSQSNYR